MSRQIINAGATDNDPSAESVNSAFTKVNAMCAELFTANGLSGRAVIDLAGADTIRAAFQKWDTNSLALYTELGLAGRININDGAFLDDPSAQSIRSAFQNINTMTATLYAAPGAGVYVATTGSDTTGTGAIGTPYRTIAKGASVLPAGGTLYLRGGTYAEGISNSTVIANGTSWATATTITAYPGETVILRPTGGGQVLSVEAGVTRQYIIFQDLILDAGGGVTTDVVKLRGESHHLRIQGGEIKNAPTGQGLLIVCQNTWGPSTFHQIIGVAIHHNGADYNLDHGIYLDSSDNLIDGCDIYSNYAYGITLYNGYANGRVNRNVISNNRVHNNSVGGHGAGIGLGGGADNLASNNLIYANHTGINIAYGGATTNKAYNNTLYQNTPGPGIDIASSSTGARVINNILYLNAVPIANSGVSTVQTTNLTTNPLFTNAGAADFTLQAGSPAINAGTTLAEVPTDIVGATRPQGSAYDIGAYED